jgi:sugar lactone lactonase YvrE
MKNHTYLLFLLAFYTIGYAQTFLETGQFGNFTNAAAFSVSPSKHFYISDSETNEITKIDSLGIITKSIGGYGWDNNSFDNPIDIYTNVLTVYVADKNNNRIQLFDRDLNSLSSFSTKNSNDDKYSFRYPTSIAVSSQGDLYVLDSDNKRVLKFNLRGEYLNSIGGIDAGQFQLSNPLKLCLDPYSNLIVLQPESLSVFDQFGNGLFKIDLPFEATNVNSFLGSIVLVNKDSAMILKVVDRSQYELMMNPMKLNLDDEAVDGLLFNSKLYVLAKHAVHIFGR